MVKVKKTTVDRSVTDCKSILAFLQLWLPAKPTRPGSERREELQTCTVLERMSNQASKKGKVREGKERGGEGKGRVREGRVRDA